MFKKTILISSAAIAAIALTGCGAKQVKFYNEQERMDMCKNGVVGDFDGNLKCSNLTSLDQFKNLTSVNGDLILSGTFKNIDALSNLQKVGGDININADVENLNGFQNLKKMGYNTEAKTETYYIKDKKVTAQKGTNLSISSNALKDISGLNNLDLSGVVFLNIGNEQEMNQYSVKMSSDAPICKNIRSRDLVKTKQKVVGFKGELSGSYFAAHFCDQEGY